MPARIMNAPAAPASTEPDLYAASDGTIYLSWIEATSDAHALRFSVRHDSGWSAPKLIATGNDWFINWADFPSVVASPGGTLAAHWLRKSGDGTYDYDVMTSRSPDGGVNWSAGATPYKEKTKGEHGFVSMLPWTDNDVLVVWLDGRRAAEHGAGHGVGSAMMLRMAIIDGNNRIREERALDERVCDCCQTGIAQTAGGAVIVYRDRSDAEIRDTSSIRVRRDGGSTQPRPVGADNWVIDGCPVNGPAVAGAGARVAVAWFTAARDTARVNVAFSEDEGATFSAPIRVDDGDPIGRVGVVLLDDGSAVIVWMEYAGDEAAIRLRRVRSDGRVEQSYLLAHSNDERASGFPAIACNNREILVAWTELSNPSRIRVASLRLD